MPVLLSLMYNLFWYYYITCDRTCVVHSNLKEEEDEVSVWSIRMDAHDSYSSLHTILIYCCQHLWWNILVMLIASLFILAIFHLTFLEGSTFKFSWKYIICTSVRYLCSSSLIAPKNCLIHQVCVSYFFTQVPSTSITNCYQWHSCLSLWFFLWKNTSYQALSKEDMGGLYWSIYCNHCISIYSKHHLLLSEVDLFLIFFSN